MQLIVFFQGKEAFHKPGSSLNTFTDWVRGWRCEVDTQTTSSALLS